MFLNHKKPTQLPAIDDTLKDTKKKTFPLKLGGRDSQSQNPKLYSGIQGKRTSILAPTVITAKTDSWDAFASSPRLYALSAM